MQHLNSNTLLMCATRNNKDFLTGGGGGGGVSLSHQPDPLT